MANAREGFTKITRDHVEQACMRARAEGVPARGGSYFVRHEGAEFPAKRILRDAYRIANGVEISPSTFSGGTATARILEALGIEVVVRTTERSTP